MRKREIAEKFLFTERRTEYYLNRLYAWSFIEQPVFTFKWRISQEGIGFLIANNEIE